MLENRNIYSLNVNQFNGTTNWKNLTEEDVIRLWLHNKDYIFTKIRLWLLNNNNLVFLNEVPNNIKNSKIIHENFIHECKINNWNVLESNYDLPNISYFKTVAVFKNGNYIKKPLPNDEPSNRILIIEDVEKHILYVGVHIPSNDNEPEKSWEVCIEQLIKIYDTYSKDYVIVYIGDTNIEFNWEIKEVSKPRYDKFTELMNKCNLCDAWLKKNSCKKIDFIHKVLFDNAKSIDDESYNTLREALIKINNKCEEENVTPEICSYLIPNITIQDTFIGHTRIDKVLLDSNIDTNYYEINYDDEIRHLQYSDHSAIYLSIKNDKFFELRNESI